MYAPTSRQTLWRQLRTSDRAGIVVVMRSPTNPAGDRYWCGPADPDSSTTWLRHRDPLTGRLTVPERLAIFYDAWEATIAWTAYVSERRRRGVPVKEFAHFLPLERILDASSPPPRLRAFAGGGGVWTRPAWLLSDARVGAGR